jgi:hypothetical protein
MTDIAARVRAITSGKIDAVPLHREVARKLAADPNALSRVTGVPFDESLFDLMGFERVRQRLTRRFFKTYRPCLERQESLWWAAENLERALLMSLIVVRRIDSATQLLRQGDRSKQALALKGISILPASLDHRGFA